MFGPASPSTNRYLASTVTPPNLKDHPFFTPVTPKIKRQVIYTKTAKPAALKVSFDRQTIRQSRDRINSSTRSIRSTGTGCKKEYKISVKNPHVLPNAATLLDKSLIYVAALPYGRVVADSETLVFLGSISLTNLSPLLFSIIRTVYDRRSDSNQINLRRKNRTVSLL